MTKTDEAITVIGGGLAGSEAAWQLAERGLAVTLYEMRPTQTTPAHQTDRLAELVCSNSFRSDDKLLSAVGLLHDELRRLDSLVMRAADAHQVPAGTALGIDREAFAATVTEAIAGHANITLIREECGTLPESTAIVATGPLTSDALMRDIERITGTGKRAFFDAMAPIVSADSLDMNEVWRQSRYDKGSDYLNAALNKEQYQAFIEALSAADTTVPKAWEGTPYFEGCLPIEVMAARGEDTLRFGPMKPVGLQSPHTSEKPYAVVQLRQENQFGTLYNLVGFQTKMKHQDQTRVFRLIPGLEQAEFVRLGGMHRNSFIHAPQLLDGELRLRAGAHLRFAGQLIGVEGYVESTAMGLLAARFAAAEIRGQTLPPPPVTTAIGALLAHVTTPLPAQDYQPMNVNYGLMPPPEPQTSDNGKVRKLKSRARKEFLSRRAIADMDDWLANIET